MAKVLKAPRMEACISCLNCMLSCARVVWKSLSVERSSLRIRTVGGFQTFNVADTCLACPYPACAEACPTKALEVRKGGGIIVHPELCIGCKDCIEACINKSLKFDEELRLPICCTYCGICTHFCPHDCLEMGDTEE
ncbi:MAG: 4Fe-4S binding protein [Dehalococcoidia bacterium]|nr:4Fe-4S binding protein [Dehalococcoidia bacterium]